MSSLNIGFIGLGLIGGSMAKSIKRVFPNYTLFAWCRDKNLLNEAVDEKIIDIPVFEIDNTFSTCDYIVLCTPVEVNEEYLCKLKDFIKPTCIITDVGSVKSSIHLTVQELGLEDNFIGGHPMTGSEKTGYKNSNAFLFENAYYAITPTKTTLDKKLHEFEQIVIGIGGVPIIMDYKLHDYIVAGVSHLPHIIAASLVTLVKENDNEASLMKQIAAGGFKDITRIASSSPIMWEQICKQNKENISELMQSYIDSLNTIKKNIDEDNFKSIFNLFDESKDFRDSIDDASFGPLKKNFAIYCDLVDEAGAIKSIACKLADNNISIKNIGILHNREFEDGVLKVEFYTEEAAVYATNILESYKYKIHIR